MLTSGKPLIAVLLLFKDGFRNYQVGDFDWLPIKTAQRLLIFAQKVKFFIKIPV